MIKAIQWALAVVGFLALLAVGVGLFLPSDFAVERSIVVDAPAERVFNLVVDPREWKKWTVWNQRDPNMQITYSGPPFGQGARWSWKSASEGSGSMTFVRVVPIERLAYELALADFGMKSEGELFLVPAGKGTRVTWTSRGSVGRNPLKRYFAVAMDRMIGPDFEGGLANLKRVAEAP